MRLLLLCMLLGVVRGVPVAYCGGLGDFATDLWGDVKVDYGEFYSSKGLITLGAGLTVGGILANTSLDEDIDEWYEERIQSAGTDDVADFVKAFGEGTIAIPVVAAAWLCELLAERGGVWGVVGEWGERSARAYIVGGPPMLILQHSLGGSRPEETDGEEGDSTWNFFEGSESVSGHAFVGAVLLMSAAKMTDSIWLKSLYYAGSTLTAWSRINDRRHYTSQALLGWWLAFLSTEAVDRGFSVDQTVTFAPMVFADAPGLIVSISF